MLYFAVNVKQQSVNIPHKIPSNNLQVSLYESTDGSGIFDSANLTFNMPHIGLPGDEPEDGLLQLNVVVLVTADAVKDDVYTLRVAFNELAPKEVDFTVGEPAEYEV